MVNCIYQWRIQIFRWGGGGGIRGGGWVCPGLKTFFSAFRASVWSKNKGGGIPGPLPWIRHYLQGVVCKQVLYLEDTVRSHAQGPGEKRRLGGSLCSPLKFGFSKGFSGFPLFEPRDLKLKRKIGARFLIESMRRRWIPKITLGIAGLHQILGRDYGIEEPYW